MVASSNTDFDLNKKIVREFKMAEIQARLNSIKQKLQVYRLEQEPSVLNFSDDQKFRPSKTSQLQALSSSSHYNKPLFAPDSANSKLSVSRTLSTGELVSGQNESSDTSNYSRVLNTDCVIMPVGLDTISKQRVWSNALVSKIYNEKLKVGNIESHGSLWKLIPRSDNHPGYRVILQSSEIGEEPKYVNSSLELVDNKAEAAVWNIRLPEINIDNAGEFVPNSNDPMKTSKGLNVIFELVDDIALEKNFHIVPVYQQKHQASYSSSNTHLNAKEDAIVLVCVYSQSAAGHELQLRYLNQYRYKDSLDPIIQSCTFVWEICPEHWINDDMEFLERYLN